MPAERNRKAPKRKPRKQPLTEDMRDLMVALAQNALDDGFEAMLAVPWRNGWNAARFGTELLDGHFVDPIRELVQTYAYSSRLPDPNVYWSLEERISRATGDEYRLLRATARCAQIMCMHNMSGDGTVFNNVWKVAFRSMMNDKSAEVAAMRVARCWDALGVIGPSLQNDKNDIYRRAFITAWDNRLYHAAYALPFVGAR